MRCAWNALTAILPRERRSEADKYCLSLQELRMRIGKPVEYVTREGRYWDNIAVREEELAYLINSATTYAPWVSQGIAKGYITAPGGHRIGLCGETVTSGNTVTTVKNLTSVNIRVARDHPGVADALPTDGNVLILGPPGCGKTTLLRDLIRRMARKQTVGVVDERGELFPSGFDRGSRTDIMTGCSKGSGIEMLLRTMGPDRIAVDEVTSEEDCQSLLGAAWCGVYLLATAHAFSPDDLRRRKVYRPLWEAELFDLLVVMGRDKHYTFERMKY